MKYFIVILFFCPLSAFTQLRSAKSRLTGSGLKGKVKQLTDYFYDSEEALKEKHPSIKNITLFDNNGREIEDVEIKGQKTTKTFYRYLGRQVIDTTYSDGQFFETGIEISDTADHLVELDLEINNPDMPAGFGHFKDKTIFKYDNKGNQIEASTYDEQGKLTIKRNLIYNNKNQVVEGDDESYRLGGIQTMKTLQSYNGSGLKIKESGYENDKLTHEGSISYDNFDKDGNWLFSTTDSKYHSDVVYKDKTSKSITIREIIYFQ
jgi:hypothetical protein